MDQSRADESESLSRLETLYQRSEGGMVAFIDESYRAPAQALGGGNTFYVLAAVLIPRRNLVAVRTKLEEIAGGSKWHTTDQAQEAEGQERIIAMSKIIGGSGAVVVAIKAPIPAEDKAAEKARRDAFATLLGQLCSTGSIDARGLVVFEQRRDGDRKRDNDTISSLRKGGVIPQTLYVYAASPAEESLLWTPDVAAWSMRRWHTHEQDQFIAPIRDGRGGFHPVSVK